MHSQIWDGMRDMFRNSAYDITALIKAAWDLKDEHALDRGQQQVTVKGGLCRGPGGPTPGIRGKCHTLVRG